MIFSPKGTINNLIQTTNGEIIEEIIGNRPELGRNQNMSFCRTSLCPKAITNKHFHKIQDEFYFFMCGSGTILINDKRILFESGDSILIQKNEIHQIINGNEQTDFITICVPAWSEDDTYNV